MGKTVKAVREYTDNDGNTVVVYPEKKQKRRAWMRGEALYGMKMRIPEDGDRCFVQFTRKNGKY